MSPGCRRRTRSAYVHCRSGLKTPSYFHSRSRKPRVSASLASLPRHHLRLGPVHVEHLRLPGFQRERNTCPGSVSPLPALRSDSVSKYSPTSANHSPASSSGKHSAHHHTAGPPDRLTNCLRDRVVPYVAVVELRNHAAPCGHTSRRMTSTARRRDPAPPCVGAFQRLATRRAPACASNATIWSRTSRLSAPHSRRPSATSHARAPRELQLPWRPVFLHRLQQRRSSSLLPPVRCDASAFGRPQQLG